MEISNGACLRTIPHHLQNTELSQEELQDSLHLRYVLMHQDIHMTCNDFGKKFLIKNTLSLPKGGLVLGWYDDATKEWVTFGSQDIILSSISYEPQINSRTVQGESASARARQEVRTAK